MTYVILGLIVVELVLQMQARTAVAGSHQRYVLMSLRRISSWVINIAFIAEGFIFLAAGNVPEATWYVLFGIFGIFIELRLHRNDDDWFNGRGKKIRRGIRRILTAPRRQPAPAPAFG